MASIVERLPIPSRSFLLLTEAIILSRAPHRFCVVVNILPLNQRVFPAEIRDAEPVRIRTVFLAQRQDHGEGIDGG